MRKLCIALLLTVVLTQSVPAHATLGPIRVELNMIKPRISAARANSPTAFKIYIRYNVGIKNEKWIKIWFPIKEASCDIKNVCDGLSPLTGKIENIRFVPNEEYFKKYPDSDEKNYGKLYSFADNLGNIAFENPPAIDSKKMVDQCNRNNCNLIEDPSKLGYWLMGTVFPLMPYGKNERYELIQRLIRSCHMGYGCFCCSCYGYPIITSNCVERSFKFLNGLELEAWRKGYNAIDFNTSKNTGIIAPATPGRYRMAVATEPEPEPVESEAFVLPCSDVADVKCNFENAEYFIVEFKTGEGGALDGGSSVINLRFPPEIKLPRKFVPKSLKLNGVFVETTKKVVINPQLNQLTLVVPTDVANLGNARLEFLSNFGFEVSKVRTPFKISLSTSSEPVFIDSAKFNTWSISTAAYPDIELAKSSLEIATIVSEGKSYPMDSKIRLSFPEGYKIPKTINAYSSTVNGLRVTKPFEVDGNSVVLKSPVKLDFHVIVRISLASGNVNPSKGFYKIGMEINGDKLETGTLHIQESRPSLRNIDLSNFQGSQETSYSFEYEAATTQAIEKGDIVSVEFPQGSVMPSSLESFKATIDNVPVLSISASGTKLKLVLPVKIGYGKPVLFFFPIGIKNPRKHGSCIVKLVTPDGVEATSVEFQITPSPLKSWIYLKDPSEPNCDGWFNKPPIVGFECLNPEAKIKIWINGNKENAMYFNGETRLMRGLSKSSITWQAEFGGELEEPQSFEISIDTTLPIIDKFIPVDEITMTNIPTANIELVRVPQVYEHLGNASDLKMVDGIGIILNGTRTELLPCQIYKAADQEKMQFRITKKVNLLAEGENIIEIVARDFACNETRIKKIIFKDTKAPDIELIEPSSNQVVRYGEEFIVRIISETGAKVTCNGKIMDIEWDDGVNSTYVYKMNANEENIPIMITSIDKMGNQKSLAFMVSPTKITKIQLTLDKVVWFVDDCLQPLLKTPPTSTFKDPKHKALNGTTYMPIAEIAPFLDCKVSWDAKEKKITLTQNNKIIEMWLGKTTARIDGKEVKYNPKGSLYPVAINGKTLLPLRFVAENLGAKVEFDAKSKSITIISIGGK